MPVLSKLLITRVSCNKPLGPGSGPSGSPAGEPTTGPTGIRRKPVVDLGSRWSAVGGQAEDGPLAVGLGGQAVPPGLVNALVTHEFGDHDDVVALADESGAEGVA